MKNRPLKNHRYAAGWNLDRITSSTAAEDKSTLGKIADEKKVSIAWVIRDAITQYLSKKSAA